MVCSSVDLVIVAVVRHVFSHHLYNKPVQFLQNIPNGNNLFIYLFSTLSVYCGVGALSSRNEEAEHFFSFFFFFSSAACVECLSI